MSISDQIQARIKVIARKPETTPDNRTDLCGEQFQSKDGREFAVIPGHCAEHHMKLFPTYEFSDEFEMGADGKVPAAIWRTLKNYSERAKK